MSDEVCYDAAAVAEDMDFCIFFSHLKLDNLLNKTAHRRYIWGHLEFFIAL